MKGHYMIGTSGWSYNHWQGLFYPEGLKDGERLAYYAQQFKTVEVNNTFYQLPGEDNFLKWKETVPEDFIFSLKASRYISHMKKLKGCEEATGNFLKRSKLLKNKLGPILFQLPPRWSYNGERLSSFLSTLEPDLRYTFEFRDVSWFNDETYVILENYGAALCLYHMPGLETPQIVTAPFVYMRFHGTNQLYSGSYPEKEIHRWGEIIKGFSNKGIDIYAYFNNDERGNAIKDAVRLTEVLAGKAT